MAREAKYDAVKLAAATQFVQGWAEAQRTTGLIDRIRTKAGGAGIKAYVPGASSVVALGTNLALLQGGVFDTFIMVTRDRSQTTGYYLGRAIQLFAEDLGVRCPMTTEASAILADNRGEFPELIERELDAVAPRGTPVALIDGVAVGHPKPLPLVDEDINVSQLNVRLERLHRIDVKRGTASQLLQSLLAMGTNIDASVSALDRRRNLVEGLSFDISYTAWVTPPQYRIMALAKMLMEELAVRRVTLNPGGIARRSNSLLVHNVAEGTPALEAIAGGTLMAGGSHFGRLKRGDKISPAEKGALIAACAVDPTYDPSSDYPHVRREVGHLYLDGMEKAAFHEEVDAQLVEMDSRVPLGLPREGLPVDETRALLREVMNWPENWREQAFGVLAMLTNLDNTATVT